MMTPMDMAIWSEAARSSSNQPQQIIHPENVLPPNFLLSSDPIMKTIKFEAIATSVNHCHYLYHQSNSVCGFVPYFSFDSIISEHCNEDFLE
jgi:hypothetical protein